MLGSEEGEHTRPHLWFPAPTPETFRGTPGRLDRFRTVHGVTTLRSARAHSGTRGGACAPLPSVNGGLFFILFPIFQGRNVAAITGRRESIYACPGCLVRDMLPRWNPTGTVETHSRSHPKNWQNHEW